MKGSETRKGSLIVAAQRKYPIELREFVTHIAIDVRKEPDTRVRAYHWNREHVGARPEALRTWVRQAETDHGARHGLTTDDQTLITELECEVRELRRANPDATDSVFIHR